MPPKINYIPRSFALNLCLLGILFLLQIQGSCDKGGNRTKGVSKPATQVRDARFLQTQLREAILQDKEAQSLFSKFKLNTSGDAGVIQANGNLLWIRDSVIWVNVKKFGIEAVRALIRPDSVFILNRLEQTYTARSISDLKKEYNLPGGFDLLQHAVLGEAWLPEGIDFQSDTLNGLHRLKAAKHPYFLEYFLDEGPFLLQKARFLQPDAGRLIWMDQDAYQKVRGLGNFPYIRFVEAQSPENGNLAFEIEFNDLEFNQAHSYRFILPDHYAREE